MCIYTACYAVYINVVAPKRANEEGHGEGVKKPRLEVCILWYLCSK